MHEWANNWITRLVGMFSYSLYPEPVVVCTVLHELTGENYNTYIYISIINKFSLLIYIYTYYMYIDQRDMNHS